MKHSLLYARIIGRLVFLRGDMLPVRIILAGGSMMIALSLLVDDEVLRRPYYVHIAAMAPQWAWAAAFWLHCLAKLWRLIDRRERKSAALLVNMYGSALWLIWTIGLSLGVGTFAPNLALAWSMCLLSAWALFRTGSSHGLVSE